MKAIFLRINNDIYQNKPLLQVYRKGLPDLSRPMVVEGPCPG